MGRDGRQLRIEPCSVTGGVLLFFFRGALWIEWNGVYLHPLTNHTNNMKATLTFPKREQAEGFAIAYQRHTKRGHIVGAGSANVEVTVFDLSDEDKEWIDGYVNRLNAIQAN